MSRAFEMLAPSMPPVTYAGVTYQRRRGVMAPQDAECLLTSPFGIARDFMGGRKHTGSDWALNDGVPAVWNLPPGETVVAADSFAGYGWGYFMVGAFADRTGELWLLLLAHLKYRPIVNQGDALERGHIVGFVDTTGIATGPHHHITLGRARDFDNGDPTDVNRYASFWRNPRDADGGVTRLHDIAHYMVDELTEPDPNIVKPGDKMGYHELILAMTDAYFPTYESSASARLEVTYDEDAGENVHSIRLTLAEQATFIERYARENP